MNANQIKELETKIEATQNRARSNPGQLARFCAGSYYLFINGELLEITHNPELSGAAKWIARESSGKWYSDPYMTLAECKADLREEKAITVKPIKRKLSARMVSMLRTTSKGHAYGIFSKRDYATLKALENRGLIKYIHNQYAYLDRWEITPEGIKQLNNTQE